MCGIVGSFEKRQKVDVTTVKNMMKLIAHRGPDDEGYEQFSIAGGEIGMGFVRLSIRDLSEAGHQPMFNANGDIAITLNGEIYNADELRQPLLDAGYTFKSTSDTEVLLDLYEHYGIDKMLPMLDGMYAVCIVDKRQDCFYLIRDRIGEKPLYYYETADTLLYGSEFKAFYYHPAFKVELNEASVDEYFLFRYVSGGDTLLKGVRNLQPGSYLKVTNEGIKKNIYWTLPDVKQSPMTREEVEQKFESLLKTSLRRRLISDRKVGMQLSGGVDSSYLAYLTQGMLDDRLHTFGIKFADKRFSEEQYMDVVNKKYNCVPHKFEFDSNMLFNCWQECTWYFEAPMNHEGTLGLLYLNRRAKDHVTVLLCGEGADETLGGYPKFAEVALRLKSPFSPWRIARLFRYVKNHKALPTHNSTDDNFISQSQYVPDYMFRKMRGGKDAIRRVYAKRRGLLSNMPGGGVRKYMNYEVTTYMQDILMRADKSSMASSMEVRVPYIMPELVEFECTIPDEYLVTPVKLHPNNNTKIMLKYIAEKIYGHEFIYRNKNGFGFPFLELLDDENMIQYVEGTLLPGIKRRKVLNYDGVEQIWNTRHEKKFSRDDLQQSLWTAFSFELWAQMYLDRKPQEWKHLDI